LLPLRTCAARSPWQSKLCCRTAQDDAHIFCLPGQIAAEIGRVLDLTEDIMTAFGFRTEGFEVKENLYRLSA